MEYKLVDYIYIVKIAFMPKPTRRLYFSSQNCVYAINDRNPGSTHSLNSKHYSINSSVKIKQLLYKSKLFIN